MKKNLAIYRLNSLKEIEIYLNGKNRSEFIEFLDQAYGLLLELEPGQELIIENDVCPDNQERFVKVSCLFITENHSDYEFSKDYSRIKRLRQHPEIEIKIIMNLFDHKKSMNNELEQSQGAGHRSAKTRKTAKGSCIRDRGYGLQPQAVYS